MVTLSENDYFGKGSFQKCYVHPNDPNLCLKVKTDKNLIDPRVDREIAYYKKIQKKKIKSDFFAHYHGEILTNYGMASVYDLVRNETDQQISKPLSQYLDFKNGQFSEAYLQSLLTILKEKLIRHKIIVRDLTAENICCKILQDNTIKLVIIDGVGHRDFFPFVEYFRAAARRKTEKIFRVKELNPLSAHREWLKKNRARS